MQLDAAGGAGAVGVQIDIALEPQRDIYGQLLSQRILTLHAAPELSHRVDRLHGAVVLLHQRLHHILRHDVRAGQICPVGRQDALVSVISAEELVDALA